MNPKKVRRLKKASESYWYSLTGTFLIESLLSNVNTGAATNGVKETVGYLVSRDPLSPFEPEKVPVISMESRAEKKR